jgi:cytochrome c biogenesis protein
VTVPVSLGAPARRAPAADPLGLPARAGRRLYGLFTSVRFAVVQIVLIALAGVIGIVLPQLPSSAFRSAADYATRMDAIRARLDPGLGQGVVGLFERLGFFRVFTAPWFTFLLVLLVVSIVICTLDRTPRLWRQSVDIRVAQPDPFFDPRLPDRAVIAGGLAEDDVRGALARARFRVRVEHDAARGTAYVYGDRHQYVKLATLLSHMGLIGFLVAGAVTSVFGFEDGFLLPVGQATPIDRIGTPDLVTIKNLAFEAPRDSSGRFTDFSTDLAVYQGGREIARKTIRVNDPLEAAGYTIHQNFFGPSADLTIRDAGGALLWSGPIPLDQVNAGRPYGRFAIPGRDEGMELLLDKATDGSPMLVVLGYTPTGATNPDGTPEVRSTFVGGLSSGLAYTSGDGLRVTLARIGAYSGVIVKRDPGALIIWLSFLLLIVGLSITFYLPRRRVWARIGEDGEVRLVARADRYVDLRREFGRLLADLLARRRAPVTPTETPASAAPSG